MWNLDRKATLILVVMVVALLLPSVSAWAASNTLIVMSPGHKMNFVEALAKSYKAKYPDVDVQTVAGGTEELLVQVAAGLSPDIVVTVYPQQVVEGALQPLDQYLEASAAVQALHEQGGLPAQLFDRMLEVKTFGGHPYMLPTVFIYPLSGFVMNKAMFEEAGLNIFDPNESPSWQAVAEAHRKITRVDSEGNLTQIGFYPEYDQPIEFSPGFGVDYVDVESRRSAMVNLTEPMTFFLENFIAPLGYDRIQALGTSFRDRKTAMTVSNPSEAARYAKALNDPLQATWIPSTTGEKLHYFGGWYLGMATGAKNVENAHRWLDLSITDVETHKAMWKQYGYAGVHIMGMAAQDPAKWVAEQHPVAAWYTLSLPNMDRLVLEKGLKEDMMMAWVYDLVDKYWRREQQLQQLAYSQEQPIRQLLIETDRRIAAELAEIERKQ